MQVDQVDGATVVIKQYFLTWGSSDLFVMPAKAGIQCFENAGSRHAPG
jgi:hypothetical protein